MSLEGQGTDPRGMCEGTGKKNFVACFERTVPAKPSGGGAAGTGELALV